MLRKMATEPVEELWTEPRPEPIFSGMSFTIVPGAYGRIDQLIEVISLNGGEYIPYNSESNRIDDLQKITHIVSATSDFPDYYNALDHFKNVVKPDWIEISVTKGKPPNTRQYSPDPALFLSGVVVFIAYDIPDGDKEAIIGGVLAMGGQHSRSLNKMVTHIVALGLDNDHCAIAIHKNLRCFIVLPHWFDDCLKLGRRIAEGPYKLPDPEILDNKPVSGVIGHKPSKAISGATSPRPTNLTLTPEGSPNSKQARRISVFKGKAIMLGADLQIAGRLLKTIEDLIQNGGGSITDDVKKADLYVCHYREGLDYIYACQHNIDVGNLTWFYHLIAHNTWTSPMRRLMHYPVPKHGIEGFKKLRMSLSNYAGDARVYLENLVQATGAQFTKTMNQHNTHLITAHLGSEKCEAAKEWGIEIVNHLWLEESYARCQMLPLTNQRYTHFPKRTNLGEVVGQTQIDRDAVEQLYFRPSEDQRQPRSNTKDKGPSSKTDNVPPSSMVLPQGGSVVSAIDQPTPLPKSTRRAYGDANTLTPIAVRSDGKENETPSSTGSRGAKARALSKLHDLAPDVALYDKEMKRKGGVVYGGRRKGTPEETDTDKLKLPFEKSGSRKRSLEAADENDNEDEDEDEHSAEELPRRGKKKRTGKPPIQYRMMLSKYEGWVGDIKKEAADKHKLRELGIVITEDPHVVNLLCVPKIVRTRKFVCALAAAPRIVSTTFLDECLSSNLVPDPDDYPLEDVESETLYGFHIEEAVARASQNKRRLLKGWTIFCTESITGGWETFKDIIAANGGNCCLWKGRTSMTVSRRAINEAPADQEVSQNQTEDEGDVLYLISELRESELPLWEKFRSLAEKHDMLPRIVSTEWLLHIAMAQYVTYKDIWELNEEKLAEAKRSGKSKS